MHLPYYDADADVDAYILPWWRQLMWSMLFVLMATVSTCGNLIVIWIVMAQKRMRTVTNIFIGKHFLSKYQEALPKKLSAPTFLGEPPVN